MILSLLIISIFAASLNSVLLHKLPVKSDVFTFNLIGSLLWIVILFAVNGFTVNFTFDTIFWGVLYGTVQMLFMIFKTKSMGAGPVSITTLIGNCSLILSTSVGVLFWEEKISVLQIIGIVALIVAFFLCTYQKSSTKSSKLWVFYCVFFFIFCAGVGIVFKCFSKVGNGDANDMMVIASITMLIIFSFKKLIDMIINNKAIEKQKSSKSFFILALSSGILSCIYNRINISISGILPSAVFFPCFNGGVILLSFTLSVIMLKERITRRQALGLVLGTVAVLIIGIC